MINLHKHITSLRRMKSARFLLAALILLSALSGITSCYRDDLCYEHPHFPKIRIEVDLSEANLTFDELKSYMVLFIPIDDGVMPLEQLKPIEHRIQSAEDYYISLAPGQYRVYIYNDYSGQNRISYQGSFDDLMVEAVSASSKYRSKGIVMGRPYTPEPDILVFDKIDTLTIAPTESSVSDQVIRLTPKRLTLTVNIQAKVMNLASVSEYIGELGEMDTRCYIAKGTYQNSGYAIPLTSDNTSVAFDDNHVDGTLNIQINSFGFSKALTRALKNGNTNYAYLYLNFKLIDGTFYNTQALDLTRIIDGLDTEKGEIFLTIGMNPTDLYPPIQIPEVSHGGAGMDATVGEWGDEEIREIILPD